MRLDLAPLIAPSTLCAALGIIRALDAAGHQALFVGGAVRNGLLGLPLKDIDIATSALPEEVASLFREARTVGAHFGVQLVRRHVGDAVHSFEIATFRAEGAYADFRRPDLSELRYGTLEDDYRRRDFTVNALYYDPLRDEIIDPAGGEADLRAGLLRTVGEPSRRFAEDALRLMRAVRFGLRYDLTLDCATAAGVRDNAPLLAHISMERIADELLKILTGPHPGRGMHLLDELGLWPWIVPEIVPMRGCTQPANYHPEGDVFVHTALVLDEARAAWQLEVGEASDPPAELMLGALLHDVGKPPTRVEEDRIRFPEHQTVGADMADAICRRLMLSNELREQVVALVAGHMRFMEVRHMRQSTLRRFLGQNRFDLHMALHRADVQGSFKGLDGWEFCRGKMVEFQAEAAAHALLPPPLLTGRDLLALGMRPGPLLGQILREAHDEQLEGKFATREGALSWLAERIRETLAE